MAKSGVNADYWDDVKARDPYIFKKAEDFFRDLDNDSNGTKRPSIVSFNDNDQKLKDGSPNPVCGHGRIFRFNDDSLLLIEFMRPKVWRIRFDPHNKVGDDFTDYNTYAPPSFNPPLLALNINFRQPNHHQRYSYPYHQDTRSY